MEDFEDTLRRTFVEEAEQMLQEAEQCYLQLESDQNNSLLIDKIFRLAHNFKGSSGAAGLAELTSFTHNLESLILKIKTKSRVLDSEIVGLLLRCNDYLISVIRLLKNNLKAVIPDDPIAMDLAATLNTPAETTHGAAWEVWQDPSEKVQAKEQASLELYPAKKSSKPKADEAIRVSLARIDNLMNCVGEVVITQTVLAQHRETIESPLIQAVISRMQKITKELQGISMSLRMVPLTQTFQKMQRIVRDTSKMLGKDIDIELSGETTEVDKTVAEMISDPLVHLVRNAVDHGIESHEARQAIGKPTRGTIKLSAYQKSDKIIIEISDDGKGLDANSLVNKAVEKGLLKPGTSLSPEEAYQLIFLPGFSTKTEISDVSGRGVGLDVVKTNVQDLQGEIKIETEVGKGTSFAILLPLSLAITEGMIVHIGDERYVVPIASVQESVNPKSENITSVKGQDEILDLRGQPLPIYQLTRLLGRSAHSRRMSDSIAVIVPDQRGRLSAVLVDEISRKQQVVIKRLGEEIHGIPGVSGSAILGDGKAALILDLAELIASKYEQGQRRAIPSY